MAKDSTTPAIRGAAGDNLLDGEAGEILRNYGGPSSLRIANLRKMRDACSEEGVDMPPFAPPTGA
jgi:hypothetical protein